MNRIFIIFIIFCIAVVAVVARVLLFDSGFWYGEAAAKMSSLAIAGLIILLGSLALMLLQSASNDPGESRATTLLALVGLAVAAYGAAELVAPNTPTAAATPACANAPVYGAKYFGITADLGVTSRSGPGTEFDQADRYAKSCTMGFDGYCIGSTVADMWLEKNPPDQRWLIVHGRQEFVSAAVVITQSRESKLGTKPDPACERLGGKPEPTTTSALRFDPVTSKLKVTAPGAAAVGFAFMEQSSGHPEYHSIAFVTNSANFSASFKPPAGAVPENAREVWAAASVCLASGVPSRKSTKIIQLSHQSGTYSYIKEATGLDENIVAKLANRACLVL